MRYKIEPLEEGSAGFKRFDLTLTVENREEYTFVHDNVARKIANASPFIGAVFNAGRGKFDEYPRFGPVPLKGLPKKKMTLKQIENALGHPVKVVDG